MISIPKYWNRTKIRTSRCGSSHTELWTGFSHFASSGIRATVTSLSSPLLLQQGPRAGRHHLLHELRAHSQSLTRTSPSGIYSKSRVFILYIPPFSSPINLSKPLWICMYTHPSPPNQRNNLNPTPPPTQQPPPLLLIPEPRTQLILTLLLLLQHIPIHPLQHPRPLLPRLRTWGVGFPLRPLRRRGGIFERDPSPRWGRRRGGFDE